MPYCVLLEVALQPCGWLASYAGCALLGETDRALRNLDGTGVVHCEVGRDAGTLTTRATLVSLSIAAGIVLVGFDVVVRAGASEVMTVLHRVRAVRRREPQAPGRAPGGDDDGALAGAAPLDLVRRAGPYFAEMLRLPTGRLLMLDRITALDAAAGAAGLGRIRAEKDVWPGDWFFRAHFFQDPVPARLARPRRHAAGLAGSDDRARDGRGPSPRRASRRVAAGRRDDLEVPAARFVPETSGSWSTSRSPAWRANAAGALAEASGSLWVDGKRIYEASGLGVRIVASHPDDDATVRFAPAAARRFWREATAMPGPWAGEDLMSRCSSGSSVKSTSPTRCRGGAGAASSTSPTTRSRSRPCCGVDHRWAHRDGSRCWSPRPSTETAGSAR